MEEIVLTASMRSRILIGTGLLAETGAYVAALPCKPETAAVITDSTVDALYGAAVCESLARAGLRVEKFVFPAGESSKSLSTFVQALEFLAQRQLTRRDVVVALGGGVTGDLAGFTAASYLRGIHLVQIPTTLLADVDSSVGGKTAVNLAAGKNLAGAFYQPELVLCDPETLKTLPRETLLDGVAESVKYGVLNDPELYRMLDGADLDEVDWERIIARCMRSKVSFVEADERDVGLRQMLNLGHTIGHAVEACSGLTITHGHAVAIGMVLMARGAYRLGLTETDLTGVLTETLSGLGLPVDCDFSAEALYAAALHDKKRGGGSITLVLPEAVGRCRLEKVPVETLLELLKQAVRP